jgi:DNA-binding GntR family transcriptional regulator
MDNLQTATETPRAVAPPTLRAHVVKMLSADILAGRYKPGDRLNES